MFLLSHKYLAIFILLYALYLFILRITCIVDYIKGGSMVEKELKRIADALEELVILLREGKATEHKQSLHEPRLSLEEELFTLITSVYQEEERVRINNNLKRKSAIRISRNLGSEFVGFMASKLPSISVNSEKGLILFAKQNKYFASLKTYTDLGFYRGEHWYAEVKEVINQSKSFGISAENTLFFISSLKNGLDSHNISNFLNNTISPAGLLETKNRTLLYQFLEKYMSVTSIPQPDKQVFFLAADIHPNTVPLDSRLNQLNYVDYSWLRPSVTELINTIIDRSNNH